MSKAGSSCSSSHRRRDHDEPDRSECTYEEMGYLKLDSCPVIVESVMDSTAEVKMQCGEWMEITLSSKASLKADDKEQKSSSGTPCRRCNLVLETTPASGGVVLNWTSVVPFLGNLHDSFSTKSQDDSSHTTDFSCCCTEELLTGENNGRRRRRRSDAALLAGLLVLEPEIVRVVRFWAYFSRDRPSGDDLSSITTVASLYVTLAFPNLGRDVPTDAPTRSILPMLSARNWKQQKPLNAGLQLILSLLESDWGELERWKQGRTMLMRNKAENLLFPSKLSLGEVYKHIQSSNHMKSVARETDSFLGGKDRNRFQTAYSFIDIPVELLQERVAPFFRSTDLAALRTTCRYMHFHLRAIVPGLRLQLFQHQIHSLQWMRSRESSAMLTEQDALQQQQAPRAYHLVDGDLHRAVTGGLTARVCSKVDKSWSIRLYQVTGNEMSAADAILSRKIVRGGMLCDDPGLGKTISVLALILQTYGLEPPTGTELRSTCTRSEEDTIFAMYWKEQVTTEFRCPELLRIVNQLAKQGFYQALSLKKAVAADAYGSDFVAFEQAAE
jgi:SNF2-related domain